MKIQVKNPEGFQYKYSDIGSLKQGQYGLFGGLNVKRLEAAIAEARKAGKLRIFNGVEYLNIYTREEKKTAQEAHTQAKGNAYVQEANLDDEIPFNCVGQ